MIEQLNTAIVFKAFFVESKLGKTGLTVPVDVYDPAGNEIVTAGAATEVGDGLYSYTLASGSVTTEGEYVCIFKTATDTVDQQHIPSLWTVGRAGIEHLDAAVSSRLSTAGYTAPANSASTGPRSDERGNACSLTPCLAGAQSFDCDRLQLAPCILACHDSNTGGSYSISALCVVRAGAGCPVAPRRSRIQLSKTKRQIKPRNKAHPVSNRAGRAM